MRGKRRTRRNGPYDHDMAILRALLARRTTPDRRDPWYRGGQAIDRRTEVRGPDRRAVVRRLVDLGEDIRNATPTRAQRLERMALALSACTGTCGAVHPGLYQPTACTLATHGQNTQHTDERRGIVWA